MKSEVFKSKYGPVVIKSISKKELLNTNFLWWRKYNKFGGWKTLFAKNIKSIYRSQGSRFNTHLDVTNYLLINIIREFVHCIMEDLIHNNDSYSFPGDKFGRIAIGYRMNPKTYNIKTQGKEYIPVLILREDMMKKIGVPYYIIFTEQWIKELRVEVEKGHRYQKPEYEFDTSKYE